MIGRVAVARALRLRVVPSEGALAEPVEDRALICPHCGATICDAARAKLFTGMVLKCNACGENRRID